MLGLLTLLLSVVAITKCTVLVDFQVYQPPPLPSGAKQCTIKVLERTFAFSYGSPEIVQFTPPTDCGTPGFWAGISLNLTVTSNGTQYDRLGVFTFQNVEIWRTSTPEPTIGDGIIWTYIKDVTRYTPLFAKPGTFILELDNVVQPGLDGEYATTVYATFYAPSAEHPTTPKADLIIPLSTLSNTSADDASVPPAFSINVTIPRNTVGLYAELYASGNGNEEFWYYNAANEYINDLPPDTTLGQGPFREVRLLIDGLVAGTVFPYATIFTGGIIPSAWRPITSYGALDLPTYFIDVSPFVPLLADGTAHNFTIDVVSGEPDHTINSNWYASGLLQAILDSSGHPTTGNMTLYDVQPYANITTNAGKGKGADVNITVTASRRVRIESEIIAGSGKKTFVQWDQSLQYSNLQVYQNEAYIQDVYQAATGTVLSTHNGVPVVVDDFSYPLNINYTVLPDGSSYRALFDHSYDRTFLPAPFLTTATISERQLAGGYLIVTDQGNYGNGTSNNTFSYVDLKGNTYHRTVNAALNNITYDQEDGTLARSSTPHYPSWPKTVQTVGKARLPSGKWVGA